jgi:succinate dehydrogenase / fumarate reductase cytochrome b subunit
MLEKNRPLSPHLGIYKWQLNSLLSILHRLSGISIYFILLLFFWLFSFNVFFEDSIFLQSINTFFQKNILGKIMISGISFLIYYHIFNGIRHLFWDAGYGFGLKDIKISGLIVIFCSLIMAILIFVMIYF